MGTIGVLLLIIIDISSVTWMIFMINKNKKMKLLTKEYDETKIHLQKTNEALKNNQTYYENWLLIKR